MQLQNNQFETIAHYTHRDITIRKNGAWFGTSNPKCRKSQSEQLVSSRQKLLAAKTIAHLSILINDSLKHRRAPKTSSPLYIKKECSNEDNQWELLFLRTYLRIMVGQPGKQPGPHVTKSLDEGDVSELSGGCHIAAFVAFKLQ